MNKNLVSSFSPEIITLMKVVIECNTITDLQSALSNLYSSLSEIMFECTDEFDDRISPIASMVRMMNHSGNFEEISDGLEVICNELGLNNHEFDELFEKWLKLMPWH